MASDSDGEEDFVTYGTPLEPLEEDEPLRKPIPIQDQMVKDEKGRFKRFHGAFTGGFSAGYFNTVGSKEGWTPSTFVSSRQQKADKQMFRPEDFMDEEDFGEHGIAPQEITTTEDFASGRRDQMRDKARAITSQTAPIPGDTVLEELVAPARTSVGVELLRKMGWKEGQGIGPRVKRKAGKQMNDADVRVRGCALPPGSEESEEEEDDYVPEDVTFAPKDVTPIDFTPKDDLHGLGYRGLNPQQALMGGSGAGHFNLFTLDSDRASSLLGDSGPRNRRRGGVAGQAFGVGALEEEDDDIYHRDALSNYDTVLGGEEPGDGLYGWTAPQQYSSKKKASSKDAAYLGKILEGFTLGTKPTDNKTVFPPPVLPRDFRPVHYFRPVVDLSTVSPQVAQALQASVGHMTSQSSQPQGRHQLDASQRRELLGESSLQGPSSVFDLLDSKDKERLEALRKAAAQEKTPEGSSEDRHKAMVAAGVAAAAARASSQHALSSRFQPAGAEQALSAWSSPTLHSAQTFKPFEKNPHKQARYDMYISKLRQGDKDALEASLDPSMTEWERGRERDEFVRAAVLYKPSGSALSSRFTRGKYEDDSSTVEVPRDQEGDADDKQAAVKMKMFGKLTRDTFEWHPDKLLCKRFNIPDPYPGSGLVGLPKVKRDKFSVFNFLTMTDDGGSATGGKAETPSPSVPPAPQGPPKPGEPAKKSRWDVSAQASETKDPLSEFLSEARCMASSTPQEQSSQESSATAPDTATELKAEQQQPREDEEEEEETRPPMDLFKAIFASSSDEKSSSSSEGESEDEEEEGGQEEAGPLAVSQPNTGPHLPAPPTPTPTQAPARAQQEVKASPVPSGSSAAPPRAQREEEEEFGPRLPPPSYPWGGQRSSSIPSSKEEKRKKKCKEKHKARKERKHKKEKKQKKKHRKQKHKGKQKKKKTTEEASSSSDASADSGSESDDGPGALSTEELLKRLKTLGGKRAL